MRNHLFNAQYFELKQLFGGVMRGKEKITGCKVGTEAVGVGMGLHWEI